VTTSKIRSAVLIGLASLLAFGALPLSAKDRPILQGSVEVILGSYRMNEPRFDAVYPKGGLLAGLGASAALVSNLNFYLEAKYWEREGALTFSKEKTRLWLVPISVGARYIAPLGIINPYLGAGGDIYFYYEDNAIGRTANSATGYHVLGGVYLRFARSLPLMINLKLKYTWAKTTQNDFTIQLGGLEYAGGIALAF
jgi:hypothetical protein